jgi:Uma2 family endonuclease
MAMPASPPLLPDRSRRDWTVDQVRALPDDGNRYEVIDGELFVTPAPSWLHQQAAMEFLFLVRPYAHRCALDCYIAPAEVAFSPRRSVEPDLFVVPRMDGRRATHFEEVQRLVLAVEVISPSSARADRYRKRHLYQSEDVPRVLDRRSRRALRRTLAPGGRRAGDRGRVACVDAAGGRGAARDRRGGAVPAGARSGDAIV